jgi:hypothetical protein
VDVDCVRGANTGEFQDCYGYRHVPGYSSGRIKSANFPLYVKVFASDSSKLPKSGAYNFLLKRLTCGKKDEACTMIPYERSIDSDAISAQTTTTHVNTNEVWYAFTLERSDTSGSQDLDFFVAEPDRATPYVDSVAAVDSDGNVMPDIQFTKTTRTVGSGGPAMQVWEYKETNGGGILSTAANSVGVAGKKYYMRVLRSPNAIDGAEHAGQGDIFAGWTTNLTWVYGSGFGGKVSCNIQVQDTQESSCDEIYLSLKICSNGNCTPYPAINGEATNGILFDKDFNEYATHDWTSLYFQGLDNKGIKHGTGASFLTIPAFGTTADIGLDMWEDDTGDADENETAWWSASSRPHTSEFVPGFQDITWPSFWDDGLYTVWGCNFTHSLNALGCASNTDCTAPLTCAGGKCALVPVP